MSVLPIPFTAHNEVEASFAQRKTRIIDSRRELKKHPQSLGDEQLGKAMEQLEPSERAQVPNVLDGLNDLIVNETRRDTVIALDTILKEALDSGEDPTNIIANFRELLKNLAINCEMNAVPEKIGPAPESLRNLLKLKLQHGGKTLEKALEAFATLHKHLIIRLKGR